MLATRIIPTILKRGSAAVKGQRFNSWRSVGMAYQQCAIHAARGVDELALLDIEATPEQRLPDFAAIERLSASLFSPLTVGGGVRTVEHVWQLLRSGADKVAICTAAIEDPTLIPEAAQRFGNQAIVLAIDVLADFGYRTTKHCGRYGTSIDPIEWARVGQLHGAGEILLTSVDRDGTMTGYDLPLIRKVAEAVTIPVIAAGGAGTYQHMLEAIQAGASAVAASSMFLFTDQTPKGAAQYLHDHGIEVRL